MSATLTDFIVAAVVGILVFTGLVSFIYESGSNYDVPIDGNYSETFDRINQTNYGGENSIYGLTSELQNQTEASEESALDSLTSLWKVIRLPFDMVRIARGLITDTATLLGVPKWFFYGVISMIMAGISFIIIAILTRRTRT